MLLPAFTHDPLPESSPHIRLLKLSQGDFGQNVVCELSAWSFNTAPPYIAISYTWGDPTSTAEITVDGRCMIVRKNCEYALQQAFHRITFRRKYARPQAFTRNKPQQQYVWLDAICIDQSNTRERGHQVAFMGELYKKAAQVLACVGPHLNDSEFLVSKCKSNKRLLIDAHSIIRRNASAEVGTWALDNVLQDHGWFALRSRLAMMGLIRQRLTKSFVSFMKRTYFTRVWVLQELYMGSKVLYCCGPDALKADRVLALSQLLDPHFADNSYSLLSILVELCALPYFITKAVFCGWNYSDSSSDLVQNESQLGCLAFASEVQRPRSLLETLKNVTAFQCADVRDKIYGVLSLVDWPAQFRPIPDYEKDVLELATEVLGVVVELEHRRLRVSGHGIQTQLPGATAWVDHLGKMFELSSTHPSVKSAIAARSKAVAVPYDTGYLDEDRPLVGDSCWRATRIHPSSSNGEDDVVLHCPESRAKTNSVTLYDKRFAPFAEAPTETRAGDWYLHMFAGGGLIVRLFHSSQYTIIGVASTHSRKKDSLIECSIGFEICWEPQDALLFYLAICKMDSEDQLLNVRACGSPGSSFARRTR